MTSNRDRHQDQDRGARKPETYPEEETGVPVPSADEIAAMKLDLRSNAENDWQDEIPTDRKRENRGTEPRRSGHGRERTSGKDEAEDEPNGSFSDSDSARVSGR